MTNEQLIQEKKEDLITTKNNKTKIFTINILTTLGIIMALLIYARFNITKFYGVGLILIGCLIIEKIFSKKLGKDVNNSFNVIIKNLSWLLGISITITGIYLLIIGIMNGCQELGGLGCFVAPPILLLAIVLIVIAIKLKIDIDNYIKNSKAIFIVISTFIVGAIIYSFFPTVYVRHKIEISSEQKKELNSCYLASDNLRYSCISNVAKKYQNEQFCEEIPKTNSSWYNECYQEVAVTKKDSELCKKISYQVDQDYCLINVAIAKQDSSLCKDILEKTYFEICYLSLAQSTKNYTLCEQVNEFQKDDCYRNIAISTKNSSLCEKMSTDQGSCMESSSGNVIEPTH